MSPSRNKFAVLVLLALLQCFAPLLHAHVHGFSGTSGVHLDGVEAPPATHAGGPSFQVQSQGGPAIGLPQAFPHKGGVRLPESDPAAGVATRSAFASVLLRSKFAPGAIRPAFPGGPPIYPQPFSRAPPRS